MKFNRKFSFPGLQLTFFIYATKYKVFVIGQDMNKWQLAG